MIEKNIIVYLKQRIEELGMGVAESEEQIRSVARQILNLEAATKSERKGLAAFKRELAAYRKVLRDSEPPEEAG